MKLIYQTGFGTISEHEPRKGTETRIPQSDNTSIPHISEHEPRKGTETLKRFRCIPLLLDLISEHEPRKGTETPFPCL